MKSHLAHSVLALVLVAGCIGPSRHPSTQVADTGRAPLVLLPPAATFRIRPGEHFTIRADDRTLCCGRSPRIVLEVTASSGDTQVVRMTYDADSATGMIAGVGTFLGPPVPHDGILQVQKDDTVRITVDDQTMRSWGLKTKPVVTYRVVKEEEMETQQMPAPRQK